MTYRRKIMPASLLIIIIGIISILVMEKKIMHGSEIIPGVFISDLYVGSMDKEQAEEAIISLYQKSMAREIVIKGGERSWSFLPEQLGVKEDRDKTLKEAFRVGRQGAIWERWRERWKEKKDTLRLPLIYQIDETNLLRHAVEMSRMIEQEAENAEIWINKVNEVEIIRGKKGMKVNLELSVQAIKEVLQSGTERECTLITEEIEPRITDEVVESWHINGVVARYETFFDPTKEDRSENIRVSAQALDHILVMPKEVFSFNETVGPRTKETGYKESLVIENNEFTPGIGGGVCQVSTTLYNTVLLAGLPIVERHPHSLPVTYAEPGRDATVTYNWADLKFINDRDKPFLLHAEYQRGKIRVLIFATQGEFPEVKLSSNVIEYLKADEEIIKDPSLPPGQSLVVEKGQRGMIVEVYREFLSDGGILTRELISRDRYKPQKAVIRVPDPPVEGS